MIMLMQIRVCSDLDWKEDRVSNFRYISSTVTLLEIIRIPLI